MQLHLSWHATRQLTLSIGCLAAGLTQTGCRPKYYCDHNRVVGGDDDEAPELEVAQPEREVEADRPTAPGQPYALPRPIVRPLVVEEEPQAAEVAAAVATAEPEASEAREAAPTHNARPTARIERENPAVEIVTDAGQAESSEASSGAIVVVEAGSEPEETEPAAAAPQKRPQPAATRRSARSRRHDNGNDPAVRSLDHAVAPSRGLGSGSSYGISLTGGVGSY